MLETVASVSPQIPFLDAQWFSNDLIKNLRHKGKFKIYQKKASPDYVLSNNITLAKLMLMRKSLYSDVLHLRIFLEGNFRQCSRYEIKKKNTT
jgi:hypothetical protein